MGRKRLRDNRVQRFCASFQDGRPKVYSYFAWADFKYDIACIQLHVTMLNVEENIGEYSKYEAIREYRH